MKKNKISFVIRTKNEEKDIEFTLQSIKNQNIPDDYCIEIILVDNMSSDNTVKIASLYVDTIVTISDSDFSWGRAINLGVSKATGNYVVLISGHCILSNNQVLEKAIYLLNSNNIVALYGRQIGDEKKDKFECIELLKRYPIVDYAEFGQGDKSVGISNAACMFRRSVWLEYKFDEVINSAEDAEWCGRVRKAGMKCAYSSRFEVIHGHYFNSEYIYKKWYWRTKLVDSRRDPKIVKMISCYPFYVFKSILIFFEYLITMKSNGIRASLISIFRYARLCEYPRYMARTDTKKEKNKNIRYNEIMVPIKVYKWGKMISKKEHYIEEYSK